tara:strand:+ start:15315 stop:16421 length:1107 start_codon:yes stop_codon:yes gene_type:complete
LPNDHVLCYDKIISFKTNSTALQASGCLFIDTEGGFMSYIPPKRDHSPVCLIKTEDDNFNLTVMGLSGNVFNYFNYRKDNTLQHGVSTGNSETFQYAYNMSPEVVTLRISGETKEYLEGKVKAYVYKSDTGDEKWYLFGKEFPEKVSFAPKKYLGNFAVGYQQAEEGLFLIMEVSGSSYNSQITAITSEQVCFDSRPFNSMEEEFFAHVTESIANKKEKLDEKSEAVRTEDYCGTLKQRNIQFKQDMLTRQEEKLQHARQGNIQQNTNAQKAITQAMFNYEEMIQQEIYDTELSICKQQEMLSRPANAKSPGTVQEIREKINCLEQQMAYQEQTKREIEKLNTQIPNDPLLSQKKGKLVMETMTKRCK